LRYLFAKRNPNQQRLLALGNPDGSLPATENEAQAVAQLYGVKPLLRKQATESQLYAQAGKIDLLHLAAHGIYDPFNPLFTRLELAPDAQHDGHLEVHEVYGLNLAHANLVVLSACDTGQGSLSNGDEIVGLAQAFLYAGAPAIVTTLWPIDDGASAVLMASFYRHVRSNGSAAEALRAAQLEVLTKEQWRSPYYWAAFGLSGDYQGGEK
jgi:CHAT domain-containing protein